LQNHAVEIENNNVVTTMQSRSFKYTNRESSFVIL